MKLSNLQCSYATTLQYAACELELRIMVDLQQNTYVMQMQKMEEHVGGHAGRRSHADCRQHYLGHILCLKGKAALHSPYSCIGENVWSTSNHKPHRVTGILPQYLHGPVTKRFVCS